MDVDTEVFVSIEGTAKYFSKALKTTCYCVDVHVMLYKKEPKSAYVAKHFKGI